MSYIAEVYILNNFPPSTWGSSETRRAFLESLELGVSNTLKQSLVPPAHADGVGHRCVTSLSGVVGFSRVTVASPDSCSRYCIVDAWAS